MTDRSSLLFPCQSWPTLLVIFVAATFASGCGTFQAPWRQDHDAKSAIERGQSPLNGPEPLPKRPSQHHYRFSQFVFYSDFPLETNDPIFRELEDLPEQIQRELRVPVESSLVQVFLFENQERYEAYFKAWYPKYPKRRAYFIGDPKSHSGPKDLLVFTYVGKHLRTDLRHELTHALLHGSLKGVPLWLDEGLAGFFEQPVINDGLNLSHWDTLQQHGFEPNMPRLEKLTQVDEMDRAEYQEAWGWVHYFLRSGPEARQVLLEYMHELRKSANPGPMYPKLEMAVPSPNLQFKSHLKDIRVNPLPEAE